MKNIVVKVLFNDEPPTKYDYKHFDVVMKTGKVHTFHHHKNNTIPTIDEMLGLTWFEVIELVRKKWYDAIENYKSK